MSLKEMINPLKASFVDHPLVTVGVSDPSDLEWTGSFDRGWSVSVGALDYSVAVEQGALPSTYRYRLTVTNNGSEAAKLPDIGLLDLRVDLSPETRPIVRYMTGSWHFDACYPPRAFRVFERVFMTEDHSKPVVIGGANAGTYSPMLQLGVLEDTEIRGLFAAFEWSAGWELHAGWTSPSFRGEPRSSFQLKGQIAIGDLWVESNSSVDLPPVHLGFFEVADWAEADDLIRGHVRELAPEPTEERPARPVAYNTWFGTAENFDLDYLLDQAQAAADLGCEYFCLDAAWYAGGETFFDGIGNWSTPDPAKFGEDGAGLDQLREVVRGLGMKFGLWLVPQVARPHTDALKQNPHVFRESNSPLTRGGYERRFGSLHEDFPQMEDGLRFALETRQGEEALIETVRSMVTRWDVDWIRVESVPEDGYAYNKGYDNVLDSIRLEFPHLFLELCNGGGQRLDVGAVARHHGNWLSDHTSDPHVVRTMQAGALRFWPPEYLNMAVVSQRHSPLAPSELDLLSRMIGSLTFSGDIAAWDESQRRLAAFHVEIFKALRDVRGRVRFPLGQPTSLEDWEVILVESDDELALLYAFRMRGPESIELEIAPDDWTIVTGTDGSSAASSDGRLVLTMRAEGAGLWARGASSLLQGISS